MMPFLFRIGPLPVYSWGTLFAVAFLVAGVVVQRDLVRKGAPGELAWSIISWGVVGGLLGARLLFVLHRLAEMPALAGALFDFVFAGGGFVWYGGVVGGVVATAFPIRRAGVPWPLAADSAALGIAIGYGIGRIGCHLAGDGDWGTPTALPWGMAYTRGIAPWPHPPGVVVHPAPLYELAASIVIFAVLWRLRTRLRPAGAVLALYLVLAGVERFLVEFIRTNRPVLLGLTEAQWTSVALVVGAGAWLWRRALAPAPVPAARAARLS